MIFINLEIEDYLSNKNYELSVEEYFYIINEYHNEILNITYSHNMKYFEILTFDNQSLKFQVKLKKQKIKKKEF